MMKRIAVSFFVFSLCFVASALAQDIRVTSTFDKKSVHINEEINLTIKVSGAKGNLQAPRLPVYDDFDAYYTGRSSHMTFINGQSSSSVAFSYILVPKAAGQYLLDPIEVEVNGRKFRTNPIQIEVSGSPLQQKQGTTKPNTNTTYPSSLSTGRPPTSTPPSSSAPFQAPSMPLNVADENIFVKAWVDKTTVYPNEQVVLTYSLFTRYDTRWEGFEEEPQVSGFWIEEFPNERQVQRETVRIAGKPYAKADIKKMALFPTTEADYTIQPGTLKVSVRQEPRSTSVFDEFFNDSFFSGGSFFARRENRLLRPQPIALKVIPYPEVGKPADFQGATGNYRMQGTIDKREVKQGEPATLTLVIEGEGIIETLEMPTLPDLPKFKVYESDSTSQLYKTGNVIGGKKTFEIVFIPLEAGNLDIPSLSFSYFNPMTKSYQTLKTPVYPLKVEPSEQTFTIPTSVAQQSIFKKDVEVEGRDIRYIHERIAGQQFNRFEEGLLLFFYGGNGALILLLLINLFRVRQDEFFQKNKGLKRKRFARSQAEARLKPLRKLLKSNDENASIQYFDEVEKILTQYLSDKFNLSAFGITRDDLERTLEQKLGPEDTLYKDVMDLYQACDEARFAKASIPKQAKQSALDILKATMSRVERLK